MALLTKGVANPKTFKDVHTEYATVIQHLAPANLSGYETCHGRSKACTAACLNTAGRGRFSSIQEARIKRTLQLFQDPVSYKKQLIKELTTFCRSCDKSGKAPAVRLNGTSDIKWEELFPELFDQFSHAQFYDYTKIARRCLSGYALPSNYNLTFSRSEHNWQRCLEVLANGVNVAVVFRSADIIPAEYCGFPVHIGDDSDLRFLDPQGGYVVGLYAKGKAKQDQTGFVVG